jgi:precorrin-6B methylase 2
VSDRRKSVFLGMPTYGSLTERAARGFFMASRGGLNVHRNMHGSSLLALNFNHVWCWALNADPQPDYFAMQHSDVEPEDGWLDALVAEMEAKGLDVLGVAAPIKDQEGKTSIALGHESGDNFRVLTRLTMREVYRLPETFTSDDVGAPLLINTGLWACRWGEWCKGIYFTVNDEIAFDESAGRYVPRVESEDWFVSRLFHEAGVRVGCTRKVELGHRGQAVFGNHQPWGTLEFDKYHVERSVLDGREPRDWFPHDVAGWLTEEEGRELARLAEGKAVLEVGSYCGRSTICLAQQAKFVTAVDTFDGRGTAGAGDTLPLFQRNIRRHGAGEKVTVSRGESAAVLPNLPPVYDLVFIDGSHDRDSVLADAMAAQRLLRPGGVIAFHDYAETDPGVVLAVNELLDVWGVTPRLVGSLAVVRPPAGVFLEVA